MKLFTDSQKQWFLRRDIKVGEVYMFPILGFDVYQFPEYSSRNIFLGTNPLTESLAEEAFLVKRIENGFCGGNFARRAKGSDFYIPHYQLARRGLIEMGLIALFCGIPVIIYNLFKNRRKKNN